FAQRVERSGRGGLQSMGHRLAPRRLFWRLRRRREALAQRKVVRLTAHRDYGYDAGLRAGFDVVGAEIAGVREQILDLAQFLGQCRDLLQHWFDLALVVGRLYNIGRYNQQASRRHRRLRVVALLEPAARPRHDARLFVRQIDLIARPRSFERRLRRLAARLLARRRDLGLARRHFDFVLRHLARIALLRPRLDRRARLGDPAQPLLAPGQFVGD